MASKLFADFKVSFLWHFINETWLQQYLLLNKTVKRDEIKGVISKSGDTKELPKQFMSQSPDTPK